MKFIVKWTSPSFNIRGQQKFESYEEVRRFKEKVYESASTLGIFAGFLDIKVEIED